MNISQNNTPRPKISDSHEKKPFSRTSGAVHCKVPLPILVAIIKAYCNLKVSTLAGIDLTACHMVLTGEFPGRPASFVMRGSGGSVDFCDILDWKV